MRIRLLIALLAFSWSAQAAYPEKPIRLILGSAAGGSVDVLMRVLAQQLSTQMNTPFVIENKPGASFVPATMDVVKAAPDGYTLGYGNIVSLAINRALLPKELQPHWLLQIGTVLCGIFFIGISLVVTVDVINTIFS